MSEQCPWSCHTKVQMRKQLPCSHHTRKVRWVNSLHGCTTHTQFNWVNRYNGHVTHTQFRWVNSFHGHTTRTKFRWVNSLHGHIAHTKFRWVNSFQGYIRFRWVNSFQGHIIHTKFRWMNSFHGHLAHKVQMSEQFPWSHHTQSSDEWTVSMVVSHTQRSNEQGEKTRLIRGGCRASLRIDILHTQSIYVLQMRIHAQKDSNICLLPLNYCSHIL